MILECLPPGSESLRLDILRRLEQGIGRSGYPSSQGDAANQMMQDGSRPQDSNQGGQDSQINERTPLWMVLGHKYIDIVIDAGKMQGRGRPCAEVQVSHAAILKTFGTNRKEILYTPQQVQRVMRIICSSLIDNSVPLSQKNTLIYYLHLLNTEYGKKQHKSLPRSVQFEILTCLVDLCKILKTQLADIIVIIRKQEAAKNEQPQNED